MKYPIGIQTFAEIIDKGYVYIDKTALVYKLANSGFAREFGRHRHQSDSVTLPKRISYHPELQRTFPNLSARIPERRGGTVTVYLRAMIRTSTYPKQKTHCYLAKSNKNHTFAAK